MPSAKRPAKTARRVDDARMKESARHCLRQSTQPAHTATEAAVMATAPFASTRHLAALLLRLEAAHRAFEAWLGSSTVQASNFNVETYGGTVYLLGIARSAEELEKAAEEASVVGGVNQVVSYVRLRNERGEIVPYTPGAPADFDNGELLGGPGS